MPYIYRTVKTRTVKKPPTGQGGRLCWKKLQAEPEFLRKRVYIKTEIKKDFAQLSGGAVCKPEAFLEKFAGQIRWRLIPLKEFSAVRCVIMYEAVQHN